MQEYERNEKELSQDEFNLEQRISERRRGRLKLGITTSDIEGVRFSRFIKHIEEEYGLSIYKAEPTYLSLKGRKHSHKAYIGRECLHLPPVRAKLLRTIELVESMYDVDVFKAEWCKNRQKELFMFYYSKTKQEESSNDESISS
jgi:hypothetical protein